MPPLLDIHASLAAPSSTSTEEDVRGLKPVEKLEYEAINPLLITSSEEEVKIKVSGTFDDWMDSLGMDGFLTENLKKEDEDCRSGYFAKSDFAEANWGDAVGYIPPIGIAVVAGSLALYAPVTFLLGAVAACTTVGTVHAASASYEFCSDAPCCGLLAKDGEPQDEKVLPFTEGVSEVTFTPADEGSLDSLDKAIGDENDDDAAAEASVRSVHGQDPSVLQTRNEVTEWVQQYFPALSHTARENMEFVGLNALEFFEVFFDNEAPYTLKEFQKKRGDKDIQYGQWEKLDNVQQPSLHSKAKSCPGLPSLVRERILNFKVKNVSYFGPPYVPATKVQRALVASKRLLVLESKNTVSDVPFCDRFYVLERWVATAEKKDDGLYHLSVSIYSQAFFTKKCAFEAQIISKSEASFKDVAKQWNTMAQEALKLTEKTRSKRIRSAQKTVTIQEPAQEDSAGDSNSSGLTIEDESIEVQHFGKCRSWVLSDGQPNIESTEPDLESTLNRRNSFGRISQSISKFVRRRSSEMSLGRMSSHTLAR